MIKLIKKTFAIFIIFAIFLCFFPSCLKKNEKQDYYEAHIEFFVNPEKSKDTTNSTANPNVAFGAYGRHIMNNIVKWLCTESFTEILIDGCTEKTILTEPMQGVPQKYSYAENGSICMTEEYKIFFAKVKNALLFSYSEKSSNEKDDANNLARSYIYVDISVKEDKQFAEAILHNIIDVVPWYVEANMVVPSGYSGTNCEITTLGKIELVRK